MDLPQTAVELNADWFSEALGVRVNTVTLEDAHSGTTGRAQVMVQYAQASPKTSSLPSRFFIKLPPTDPQQRAFVTSSGMGVQEARFYRDLSAEVPVRVPRCYFADWDETGEHYVMVLEQLQDAQCTFRNTATRYSQDYLRAVLSCFARLHAHYWESPRLDKDLGWIGPIKQHEIARKLLPRTLSEHGAKMPPIFSELCELYLDNEDALHKLWREGDATLVHGDVHDGNLFYDERLGEPGFLDWAVLAKGPAMRDVAYFLAGTLGPEEQVEQSPRLLQAYSDGLQQRGLETVPGLAELQRQYAIQAVYPWLGAAVTLAMGDAWQNSNYVLRSLDRLHTTLELLRSPAQVADALEGQRGAENP